MKNHRFCGKISRIKFLEMFFNTAFAQASVRTTQEETTSGLTEFFTSFFTAIPFWIAAGVVIFASFFLANIIKKIVIFRLSKRDLHREVLILIERMVYTGIVVLGLIIAFKIVGINLALVLGFIGLGVGFALKDLLANFFAGIMILTQEKCLSPVSSAVLKGAFTA